MAIEDLASIGLQPLYYEHPVKHEGFWFEKIDINEARLWTRQQLPNCVAICAVYLLFVALGPKFMKNRKPVNLKQPLIIWNFLLAIFSIAGTVRMVPSALEVLMSEDGFYKSACVKTGMTEPLAFWGLAFTLSKIAELMDTVFIILRKKPLIVLHWFHHLSMVGASFFLYGEGETLGGWSAILNFGVHSIMYSYYTIRAIGFKVPKKISMMVTSIQILQFVTGLSINAYTLVILALGQKCFRTRNSVLIYFFLGPIYLSLFIRLFYKSYIAPTGRPKKQQ